MVAQTLATGTGGPGRAARRRTGRAGRSGNGPRGLLPLLGPAFVAAIAYVDPGNVAANLTAGAQYGYLLVWVLVVANAMAVLVQYLSAKLGLVTGRSLPELLGERLRRPARLAYWVQAEVVAAATDLAEVIGGAIALHLLFGVPLLLGGVIVGVVSMVHPGGAAAARAAAVRVRRDSACSPSSTVGFLTGLARRTRRRWADVLGGLVPRFEGTDTRAARRRACSARR